MIRKLELPDPSIKFMVSPKTGKPYREHTRKQSHAVRRNFALMQLSGMQSSMYTVYNCLTQERNRVRVSVKLNYIHKLLDELKETVKNDYDQWKLAEAAQEKKLLEKGGT